MTATLTPTRKLRCTRCGGILSDHEMFGACYDVPTKGSPSSLVKRGVLSGV